LNVLKLQVQPPATFPGWKIAQLIVRYIVTVAKYNDISAEYEVSVFASPVAAGNNRLPVSGTVTALYIVEVERCHAQSDY
jgi:hypothetical protein